MYDSPKTRNCTLLAAYLMALCLPHWSNAAEAPGPLDGKDATPRSNVSVALEEQIEPLVKRHDGVVAVGVTAFHGHKVLGGYFHQADRTMPAASLIKLPIMAEVYRQIEAGELERDVLLELKEDDKVPGSGILTEHFTAGTKLRLDDAVRLMIRYSDNTATNLVIDAVGLKSTSAMMAGLEMPETQLHSKVYRGSTTIAPERSKQFGLSSTTARDMVALLAKLHKRELVSPSASRSMLGHLRQCDDDSMLARFLPEDVRLAHKSGAISRARTDAGLLSSGEFTIAICVLTADNSDQSWGRSNDAEVLCGRIAVAAVGSLAEPSHTKNERDERSRPLSVGATGPLVEALQRTLNERLSGDLAVDGDFGPATLAAVREFQQQANIDASGRVTVETWKALGQLVEEKPVADPQTVNSESLPKSDGIDPDGPPAVSCKAWCVIDAKSGKRIGGHRAEKPLPMASTTKIMTAHLILDYTSQHPKALAEILEYSRRADETVGSTSGVRAGERLSVGEALYGLLLPSGNDASVALAEHFGMRLADELAKDAGSDAESVNAPREETDPLDCFVQCMNARAEELGMKATRFRNPHGLTAVDHRSSPADLALLARLALRNPLFRQIVSTRQHGCRLESVHGYSRNVIWRNTNRLLAQEGFFGIKTGTTSAAGACLVSLSEIQGTGRIVVTLGSTSSDNRYIDARNLHAWAARQ